MEPDQQYLSNLILPLLSFPDEVVIKRSNDDRGVLLEVDSNKVDVGRLIGQKGETARAIRRLLRLYGTNHDQHISFKINEVGGKGQNNDL